MFSLSGGNYVGTITIMIIFVLILLGLCLGSFINALVWRLHEQNSKSKKTNLSITKGRSQCVHCGHTLTTFDLIPLLSWLLLLGRCRYCHKPISKQYPLVESLTAGLFVFSYLNWPMMFDTLSWLQFGLWLISLVILLALLIYDARWMLLPDRLVWPGVAVTALFAAITISQSAYLPHELLLTIGSVAIASGLFLILFVISAGEWIGGGDVKLGIMLGFLLGTPPMSILMLFVASLMGTFWAVPSLLKGGGLKLKLPFGPFLIAATVIVFFYGESAISWYSRVFLP